MYLKAHRKYFLLHNKILKNITDMFNEVFKVEQEKDEKKKCGSKV
jgi:hypothetical protein